MRVDDAGGDRHAMGLFNTTSSYHLAARKLQKLCLRGTHPDMPVRLLYFHTIDRLPLNLAIVGRG